MQTTEHATRRVERIVALIETSVDQSETVRDVAARLAWTTETAVALVDGLMERKDAPALRAIYLAIRTKAGSPG